MKRISIPTINDKREFHSIALKKRKTAGCKGRLCSSYNTYMCDTCIYNNRFVMLSMENYVFNRYDEFDDHLYNLEELKLDNILGDRERNLLIDTFESKEFEHVRQMLIDNLPENMKGICPFCMIGEPSTMEHYLPKKIYPEYTLYSKNLIPCCSYCNSKKGIRILNDDRFRMFINFYTDNIEDTCFLKTIVELENGLPVIKFFIDLNPRDPLYSTIVSHFDTLHLFSRYKSRTNSIISSVTGIIKGIQSRYSDIDQCIDECIFILNIQISTFEKQFGINYWKASVLKAMINNKDILKGMVMK